MHAYMRVMYVYACLCRYMNLPACLRVKEAWLKHAHTLLRPGWSVLGSLLTEVGVICHDLGP